MNFFIHFQTGTQKPKQLFSHGEINVGKWLKRHWRTDLESDGPGRVYKAGMRRVDYYGEPSHDSGVQTWARTPRAGSETL